MANRESVKAVLNMVVSVAKAVCETYRQTGLPVPQGPMYAALMGVMSIHDFQAMMTMLGRSGFEVTTETITPGPEIMKGIEKRLGAQETALKGG